MTSLTSSWVMFSESFEWTRFVLEYFFVVNLVVEKVWEIFFYSFEFSLSKKWVAVSIKVTFLAYLACEFYVEIYFNFFLFIFVVNFFQLIQRCRVARVVKEDLTQRWGPFIVFTLRGLILDCLIFFFHMFFFFTSIL